VLRRSEATAYADQLVGLAKRLSIAQRTPLLAMANRADLATRVRAVLDARQQRGRAGAFSLGLATTAAMVLVISMSSLILVATPQAAPAQTVTSPTMQGEPSREKPKPGHLVAQAVTPEPPLSAQQAPASQAKLEFEVASLRRVDISAIDRGVPVFFPTGGIGTSDPTHYAWHGAWLTNLITVAFGVRGEDISGPGWVRQDRYDIVANIPEGATKEQFNAMLGNLLRDRLHLRFHLEKKVVPAYALRVGKNGPKFKEAVRHDDAKIPTERVDAQGFPVPLPDFKGIMSLPHDGQIFIVGQDVPMADLAQLLGHPGGPIRPDDRPVIDETGLAAHYDFKMHHEYLRRPGADAGVASDPAPSVLDAVEQQLGLKLESTTTSITQLIIDSIDREPAAN
jgi:uncharacterized protein (TIGR03435 family)